MKKRRETAPGRKDRPRLRTLKSICLLHSRRRFSFLAQRGRPAESVAVKLDKPTDYAAIYQIADTELAKLRERKGWSQTELCLHLSPGTPAMAAVWVLLGKTRYPATFYETYAGKSSVTEIPFDLTVDVIADLFRNPDFRLQHLASETPSEVEGFQDIAGESRAIRGAVGRAKRAGHAKRLDSPAG